MIVKLDIKNMFNEVTCAAMIHVFEQHPDLWSMVPFLFATHSPKSLVFYTSGKHAKPCVEGSRQGAAEAPENTRLIQYQINHNFSVFRVHARSFAQVQF